MSQPELTLATFTRADLAAVEPWFADYDTQRFLGGPDCPVVTETVDAVTGAYAFVVDPAVRRRGYGLATIGALVGHRDLRSVELFEAGVEPENTASRRCLQAAGFALHTPQPGFGGMLYYRLVRVKR